MKTLNAIIAGALALFVSSAAFAQADSKTQQILDELAQKTAGITSYTADIIIETKMMGQPRTTEGAIAFKAPDKLHMITSTNMLGGEDREIFSSGDVVHTYAPAMKTATRTDALDLKAAAVENISSDEAKDISKPFESYRAEDIEYLGSEKSDSGEIYLFDASPAPADQMPSDAPTPQTFGATLVFRIHAATGLPTQITMLSEGGAPIWTHTYTNIRVNIPISDSKFEFRPPRDVKTVDLTDGVLNMTSHPR